ncbi:MAG: hypothetical protein GY842_19355 [bacterium]|nr:hypothetical protein [bacterium]
MSHREQRDLFEAVLAVAGADGRVTRSERGLLEALAERVGVGCVSLNAMIDRVLRDAEFKTRLSIKEVAEPLKAMELLVAAARIDGEISEEERELLVRISSVWNIPDDDFVAAFERGIAQADRLRAKRTSG